MTKLTKNRTRNLTEHSEKSANTSNTIYGGLTDLQVDNAKTQRCSINREMLKYRNVLDTDTFARGIRNLRNDFLEWNKGTGD